MALISSVPVVDVASIVASALEELLGHDVALAVGAPALGVPADDNLPAGPTRTVVLPFSGGHVGELSLVVSDAFATAMSAVTDDASLTAAALPALGAAADAIELVSGIAVNPAEAGEIATDTLLTSVVGEFAAVPILENDTRVASVVVRLVGDDDLDLAGDPEFAASGFAAPALTAAGAQPPAPGTAFATPAAGGVPVVAPPAPHAPALPAGAAALHEFQPLGDGRGGAGPLRPIALLNDVNMEVTAELGRGRVRVRDLVALRPGTVIELDRAAGSPVDVLVNGALVWHGEVVVVDDEFGIRVSEIVTGEG